MFVLFFFQTEHSLTNLQRSIHPITLQKLRGILYLQENEEKKQQQQRQQEQEDAVEKPKQEVVEEEKKEDILNGHPKRSDGKTTEL